MFSSFECLFEHSFLPSTSRMENDLNLFFLLGRGLGGGGAVTLYISVFMNMNLYAPLKTTTIHWYSI